MCDSVTVLFLSYFHLDRVSMKNKSKKFAEVKGTYDRFRSVIFKFVFRKLRKSAKTWQDISDILSINMPDDHYPRSDLLNHYNQGTKVPSSDQLLTMLNALNETIYTSSTVINAIKFIHHHQKYSLENFNKQDIKDFNIAMIKIATERDKAIKKASEQLKIHLKTLVYLISTNPQESI